MVNPADPDVRAVNTWRQRAQLTQNHAVQANARAHGASKDSVTVFGVILPRKARAGFPLGEPGA